MLISRLWLDSVLRPVVALVQSFDRPRPSCSRSIKALRLALCLALHRIIGFVSVQLIEALGAVLIMQLAYHRILGAV